MVVPVKIASVEQFGDLQFAADKLLAVENKKVRIESLASSNLVCVGRMEVLATPLEHGADVDVYDDDGAIPLHSAAHNGHVEVVATLVQRSVSSQ